MGYINIDRQTKERGCEPGFFRRMPWRGLLCVLGALSGLGACIAILAKSDGLNVGSWQYAPTVYLSICYTLSNVLLGAALSCGVPITWWRRAMGPRTELGDLHRYWLYGTSPLAAATAGRKLNMVALACLLVAITPVNGPLLQRASSITPDQLTSPVVLTINTTASLTSATGYIAGRQGGAGFLTKTFASVVQQFYDRAPIVLKGTGCPTNGICEGRLRAAGLAVTCSNYSYEFDSAPSESLSDSNRPPGPIELPSIDAFKVEFDWRGMGEPVQLNTQYRVPLPSEGCVGLIKVQNCTLRPATVLYPVTINGNLSTIALDPTTSVFNDDVGALTNMTSFSPANGETSQLAGYSVSLQNRFDGTAVLRWAGAIAYEMDAIGATPSQFAVSGDQESCALEFLDPMSNMLAQARELMFRTALGFANESAVRVPVAGDIGLMNDDTTGLQTVSGSQFTTSIIYRTHYGFLIGAAVLTLASALAVLTTYHGFWHLGRNVSLSPLEVAKAFNAPLLAAQDSNAEVDVLVATVGAKHVRYELAVASGRMDARDELDSQMGAEGHEMDDLNVERRAAHLQIVEQ